MNEIEVKMDKLTLNQWRHPDAIELAIASGLLTGEQVNQLWTDDPCEFADDITIWVVFYGNWKKFYMNEAEALESYQASLELRDTAQ